MSGIFRLSKIKISSVFRIIPGLSILMEILCVYPWLVWLGRWLRMEDPKPHMNLDSYVILMLYTEIISRTGHEKGWSNKRMQLAFSSIILLWFVLFRFSLGGGYAPGDTGWFGYINNHLFPSLIAILTGPYFIWRGINISRQSTYQKFITGLVFVILLLIIWNFSGLKSAGLWSTIGIYAFSYFSVGLLALALANIENLKHAFTHHQEAVAAFRRRLFSMQLAIIISVLIIAVTIAGIFSSDISGTLVHAVSMLWDSLVTGLSYVFYIIGFAVEAVYYVMQWIIYLITRGKKPTPINIKLPEILKRKPESNKGTHGFQLPPVLVIAIKWILLAALVAIIIYFIGRTLTRYWRARTGEEEGFEEEHESLWSWTNFKADLKNLFGWLFPWLRRRRKEVAGITATQETDTFEPDPGKDMNVREIYRALLRRGRLIGLARKSSETAYEYSARLGTERKATGKELDSITEAYVMERYGEKQAGPEKTSLLNRLWTALNSKLLNPGSSSGN